MRQRGFMTDRHKVIQLILVVTGLVLFATALSVFISYRTAFGEERERLLEAARSEARMIEAMFDFEQQFAGQLGAAHGDVASAILNQLTTAHSHFPGFGATGEYTLARREGDQIVFLLSHRHFDLDKLQPVSMTDARAEPMRQALAGHSGTLIGLDYRGERVLAAFEPIAKLNWGVVAKIDLAEIRAPFWETGALAGGISVVLAIFAGGLIGHTGNRLVRRISEKEKLYRSLVENIDLGISLVGADYRILMTNGTLERIFTRPVGEFLGSHCYREFEKRATVCPYCPGTEAMRSGQPAETVTKGVLDDGREIDVHIRAFPILDDGEKATGFIEVIEDITERKRFEDQLAETRRQLQALMDNLPGMAYRCRNDADWTMEFVSQGSADLTGYTAGELIGSMVRSYASLVLEEDRERIWNEVQQALGRREAFSLEYRIVTAAGQTRHVWEKGSGVFAENGEVTALEGFIMDVSERKAAENDLRERKEFIETIIANLPIGLSVHTIDDGRFHFMNRKFQEIYGWPRENLLDVEAFFEHVYPDPAFRRNISARIHADMASGDPERMAWENVPITRESGEKAVVSARNIPMIGKNLMISTVWDVTAHNTAQKILEATIADLQRSNRELEQFAYIASHDLQEPLRMVGSYVQLLARRYRGRLDADADLFIDFAVEGATRMQQLINDLLSFSRAGRQQEPLAPVDCNEVLANARKNLQRAIEEAGASIQAEPLPTVLGNASQLTQVFQNLLANAIKFHGPQPPQIWVSAEAAGEEWVFAVRDNGIGIDPQYFKKIFIIFQRLHGKKEYPGTGIGLALTNKIIEQHGGRIWIESTPGQGTTFFFTLKGAQPT
jgi:PAS domain S-box-containing protein